MHPRDESETTFRDLEERVHLMSPDKYLDVAHAAFVLGLSTSFLNHARSNSEPPPFVAHGKGKKPLIRYRLGDLMEYLNGRRVTNTIEARNKLAMGRVVDFAPWTRLEHPFWVRGAFVLDSVFSDKDKFLENFQDTGIEMVWMTFTKGFSQVWEDEAKRSSYIKQMSNSPKMDNARLAKWRSEVDAKHQEYSARLQEARI